ncbi:MAG: nitroreductase [Clostridiaceae bacterium]|nr:nitroreductase [Clostridiaceae bacterium]
MNIRSAIIKRKSVRTYKEEPVPRELMEKISSYIKTVDAPFNTGMRFKIIDPDALEPGIKLGTYGVIKGAKTYLCAVAKKEPRMEENLGYVFEKIILYITSLGLGTCWLGGTFKRKKFEKAVNLEEDEFVPVVTPIGFAREEKSTLDKAMATTAGSRNRKDWSELFFDMDFSTPLKKDRAGMFSECLEMVRIAPSATNRQPWRIIRDGNYYHFFLCRTPGYRRILGFDIQRLDIGIAMCHFESTLIELCGSGKWCDIKPDVACPENTEYIISYMANV